MVDALQLLWREQIEQDGFNALVVRTGMTWWQANVLRAYAKYLRQAGTTYSQGYIEQALIDHPAIASALVELFETRFDPERARPGARPGRPRRASTTSIRAELAEVASLDQDRILRSLLALINATLRTNAYRADDDGNRAHRPGLQARPARDPRTAASPGRGSRSGCTRRASRACTCASARSPAAACGGRTAARTSAPRSSGWSRRRW